MSEIELPEIPEKEMSESNMNTIIAITVTTLVTFMAFCKIHDNNIVLDMQEFQAEKVDKWSWYNSLHIREDINTSRLSDLKDDLRDEENPLKKKVLEEKIKEHEAVARKIEEKKEKVKAEADADSEHYEKLNAIHEKFDHSEAAISIAVSLLALTSLLKKHPMYFVAMIPGIFGIVKGVMGLLS